MNQIYETTDDESDNTRQEKVTQITREGNSDNKRRQLRLEEARSRYLSKQECEPITQVYKNTL
jgi:hypothetical protein